MKTESPENAHLRHIRELDPDIDDRVISAVFVDEGGWRILAESDTGNVRLVWVPAQRIVPRLGDNLRIYGHRHLRGIDINGENIFYSLPPLWDSEIVGEIAEQLG